MLRKEIGAAKSETKKAKREAGLKSFELMVKYCETASCRHAVFSRYFGDTPPRCGDKCDVCRSPKEVAKALAGFESAAIFKAGFTTGPLKVGDSSSLYGEGRMGQKRIADEYGADERDDDTEGRENRAKKQLRSVIHKQFKLRKAGGKDEEEEKKDEEKAIIFAKVKAHLRAKIDLFKRIKYILRT